MVTRAVSYPLPVYPYNLIQQYDSTTTTVSMGTWQATGSEARVALHAGSRDDTLRLVVRGDGGVQDTTARVVYARR